MNLCQYKHLFGEPGEGVHKYRIFDISIVDVLVTLLFAYIITYFSGIALTYVIPFVFLLGIVVHRVLCVRTKVDRILFPDA